MCDCPKDWMLCFRHDCERAAPVRKEMEEAHRKALEWLGDPMIGVYFGPLPDSIGRIIITG